MLTALFAMPSPRKGNRIEAHWLWYVHIVDYFVAVVKMMRLVPADLEHILK